MTKDRELAALAPARLRAAAGLGSPAALAGAGSTGAALADGRGRQTIGIAGMHVVEARLVDDGADASGRGVSLGRHMDAVDQRPPTW